MIRDLKTVFVCCLLPVACCLFSGCKSERAATPKAATAGSHDKEDHEHAKGVVTMGDYHAKILIEQGGALKLIILGKDETKITAIETQEVQGHLKAESETEAVPITLKPDPQPGDPDGKTSQFAGQLPESLRGKSLIATFRLTIAGQAYRPEFRSASGNGHADMPKGVQRGEGISEEEKQHYLTPGGIYTVADIKANGEIVPTEKFKGIRWLHPKAKEGDKICPVTLNKADPKCSWIVGNEKYEFCCPPCLDTFIEWAKYEPDKVKKPTEYVKE